MPDDHPTEKQLKAIKNMRSALGSSNNELPRNKKEASVLIAELKKIIDNNISLCGYINPRRDFSNRSDAYNELNPNQ